MLAFRGNALIGESEKRMHVDISMQGDQSVSTYEAYDRNFIVTHRSFAAFSKMSTNERRRYACNHFQWKKHWNQTSFIDGIAREAIVRNSTAIYFKGRCVKGLVSYMPHYSDVIMGAISSQITILTIGYSTVYSRRRSKETSKFRVTGLCAGNSPVTGELPSQRASYAENVSIRWRHHE